MIPVAIGGAITNTQSVSGYKYIEKDGKKVKLLPEKI
jgi:hypothetical protein